LPKKFKILSSLNNYNDFFTSSSRKLLLYLARIMGGFSPYSPSSPDYPPSYGDSSPPPSGLTSSEQHALEAGGGTAAGLGALYGGIRGYQAYKNRQAAQGDDNPQTEASDPDGE
jgi:hypothetical protein